MNNRYFQIAIMFIAVSFSLVSVAIAATTTSTSTINGWYVRPFMAIPPSTTTSSTGTMATTSGWVGNYVRVQIGTTTAVTRIAQATSTCPLILPPMKIGSANIQSDVVKLQTFLRNVEKIDVDINGIFDQKTERAVIAFQERYKDSILAPWGGVYGSGIVHITTAKKINQIACNVPLALNTEEVSYINSYKANKGSPVVATPTTRPTVTGPVQGVPTTTVSGPSVNATSSAGIVPPTTTTTATSSSLLKRFGNFFRNLF